MLLKLSRMLGRALLRIMTRLELRNFDSLPECGSAIVVSNHVGRLDAMIAMILTDRDDVIMMVAEKYQKYAFWRWVVREMDALWLDRYQADFGTLREVLRRLRGGGILGMAPEGTRSTTATLQPAKQGAAYLAIKSGAPIYPIAVTGTADREVLARLKRLQRQHITITVGEPFTLPQPPRQEREAALQRGTDEMMCRIAAMLPPQHRGVYADHPRLRELLNKDL